MKRFVFFLVFFGGAALAGYFQLFALSTGLIGFGFGFIMAVERVHKAVTGEPLSDGRFGEVLERIL